MKTARFLIFLLSISMLPAQGFAQTATSARISGLVKDANGGVVNEATVTLVNKSTNKAETTATSDVGRYAFANIEPGTYDITVVKSGFRKESIADVKADVSKAVSVDITLQPGGTQEQVTITAATEVQLQKDDATVGAVIDQVRIARLPNADRQATSLLTLQPGVPTSGEVTGSRADQNTFNLDGIDVSDNIIGLPFRTIIPVPTESLEELRVTVSNQNASFGRSAGSQVVLETKRGTNQFHGSLYEYHQDAALNSNSWDNNFLGLKRPPLVDNRFGASFGGPIWKQKVFFFFNYEGRRLPGTTQVTRNVPTDSLRAGLLEFRDASGVVQTYNPKTFDPLHKGSDPSILTNLSRLPEPNNFTVGDGLNTAGFTTNLPTTLRDDFGVLRLDYQLNDKWSFSGIGRADRNIQLGASQADLVHLKGGNTTPSRPRFLDFAVTGALKSTLVNEFRYGYAYDNEVFGAISPTTIAGYNVAAKIGPLGLLDDLIDVDTQRARSQANKSGVNQFIDNATWTKGTHTFQFGGNFRRIRTIHIRDDKVIGSLATPVAQIGALQNIKVPQSQIPAGITVQDLSRYTGLYTTLLGEIDQVGYLATRDAKLDPNPVGTPLINDTVLHHWEFYFADTWKVNPSFTVTGGLAYSWHTPPTDTQGRQSIAVYKDSLKPIDPIAYLNSKRAAAENGDFFNPDIAYVPIKQSGLDGAFVINRHDFSPRISAAWQPSFKGGFLAKVFGDRKTVIRGGYALTYDRANTVATVIIPMLGVGFAQTLSINGPQKNGNPLRVSDGPIPLEPNTKATSPIVPDSPFGELLSFVDDPRLKDPRNHSIAFTIQREMRWNSILEIGYVGRLARDLYQSYNLNSNPYMFKDKKSGQTFAQAYDAVATQLRNGVDPAKVTPQPFFENLAAAGGGTRGYAQNNQGDIINGDVANTWQFFLDFVAPQSFNNQQVLEPFYRSNGGLSNYHALIVSFHKRHSHGLSFDLNYTFSKSLDQVGAVQNSAGELSNSYFPNVDYGPSFFDRTHSFNGDWVYDLPFGKDRLSTGWRWLNSIIGNWFLSGIIHAETGQPLGAVEGSFASGSQVFGGTLDFGYNQDAISVGSSGSTGRHNGVTGTINGTPLQGTGINLFGNPASAFNSFRPVLISQDTRLGRGAFRGLGAWQIDASLGKTIRIKERMSFGLTFDVFNVLNHVNFADPATNLFDPANFGVITTQLQPNPNGFPLAQTFYRPRAIQIGARFQF